MVRDGVEHPRSRGVSRPYLPRAGGRSAWIVYAEGREELVVDGVLAGSFAGVENIRFSGDGRVLAAAVRLEGDSWAIWRDGAVGEAREGRIEELALSHDGARMAWVRAGAPATVWVDGVRVELAYPEVQYSRPGFSADGSRWWVRARTGGGDVLVVDGGEVLQAARFDPDYVRVTAGSVTCVHADADGASWVTHGGTLHGPYAMVWSAPVVTPDGSHAAWVATLEDGLAHAVVDGVPGPAAVTRYGIRNLVMSGNGVVAFVRETGERQYSVHRGSGEVVAGAHVGAMWLSADGARCAWVQNADGGWRVVVEGGAVGEPVFRDIADELSGFAADGTFAYLATRDRESFTVRLAGIGGGDFPVARPDLARAEPRGVWVYALRDGLRVRELWAGE
jgi:hypothetical protein